MHVLSVTYLDDTDRLGSIINGADDAARSDSNPIPVEVPGKPLAPRWPRLVRQRGNAIDHLLSVAALTNRLDLLGRRSPEAEAIAGHGPSAT
jgi:hypothetical protein